MDNGQISITFGLADTLDVHHLDVVPREQEAVIELEVHATIRDVSERKIQALGGSQLVMERLVCSTTCIGSD